MPSRLVSSEAGEHLGETCVPEVVFPAGNSDFRAVRNRCAQACREFNNTPEDADPEMRSQKWLDIVRPDRDRSEDGPAVTHDLTFANPSLKAKTPFVKPPVWIDYGVRLHVGGSTFINRDCKIMDTPVADIVIGEGCNIGPNCVIVGVKHPLRLDERLKRHSIGQPVTIGNNVWIGANVTILGGVTIGDGAVIGTCSLVSRDVPPMSVAFGTPARVVKLLDDIDININGEFPGAAATTATRSAETLAEAMALGNRLPMMQSHHHTLTSCAGARQRRRRQQQRLKHPQDLLDDLQVGNLDLDLNGNGQEEEDLGLDDDDDDIGFAPLLRSAVSCPGHRPIEHGIIQPERRRHARGGCERGQGQERRQQQQQQQQRSGTLRRPEMEAVAAVVTVVVGMLVAFFFAGLYLGSKHPPRLAV